MSKRISFVTLLALVSAFVASLSVVTAQQTKRRPLKLDDLTRLREVRDPQCSPDGQTVAFVTSTIDTKEDKGVSHIWMVGYDGKMSVRLRSVLKAKRHHAGVLTENILLSLPHVLAQPKAIRFGCSTGAAVRLCN